MQPLFPIESVAYLGKGIDLTEFTPGDFLLISDNSITHRVSQFFQGLWYSERLLAKWNHAVLIVNPAGETVEVIAGKVSLSHIDKYIDKERFIVKIDASIDDRHKVVDHTLAFVNDKLTVSKWIGRAIALLSSFRFAPFLTGSETSASLIASAMCRTRAVFPTDSRHISPFLLATYYTGQSEKDVTRRSENVTTWQS